MFNITRCVYLALMLAPTLGHAQSFEAGQTAHDSGDYVTALREWSPLAQNGDHWAQYWLGDMYRRGHGVPQNDGEAVKWYRLAAEQGNAWAQSDLGLMYTTGLGVPQDYAEALRWIRLAAGQGDALAQNNLGRMYLDGTGVPQDYIYAQMWFLMAFINGDQNASANLDISALKMTPVDLSEAERRAKLCMESSYKSCD